MDNPVLTVRDWDKLYENNRSRTVTDLRWVLVPNRHDGDGYCQLMAHPDAAEIYTAWHLILQVASRCHPRGTLLQKSGSPHDAESLALRTRGQLKWFTKAIPFLLKLQWLRADSTDSQLGVTKMAGACQSPDEERRKEGRKGQTPPQMAGACQSPDGHEAGDNHTTSPSTWNNGSTPAARVEHEKNFKAYFWDDYPKQHGYESALRIWVQLNPDLELMEEIHEKVRLYSRKCDRRENGRFILNPFNWLSERRWTDQILVPREPVKPVKASQVETVPPPPFAIEGKPVVGPMIGATVFNLRGTSGTIKAIETERGVIHVLWQDKATPEPIEPCRVFWTALTTTTP